jgi:cation:H+ antiporter
MQTIFFWSAIGLLSLFLIVKSAENALNAIIRFAEETKITYYFIGLFIVSIGTSLPEIFTAVISSLEGNPQLVVGDAMGATIVDVTLVIGITLLFARRIAMSQEEVHIVPWKILLVVMLPLMLAIDGKLDRLDGILLVSGFALYYLYNIVKEFRLQDLKKYISPSFAGRETVIFGVSLALLIFGVQLLVLSATNLAELLSVPSYIFGALILGVATTSPEFIIELKAVKKHESTPIAFGDIFGSVLCNTSLVIGISAIISPVMLDYFHFYSVGAFMLLAILFSLWCIRRKELVWVMGIGMLSIYAVFILVEISRLVR